MTEEEQLAATLEMIRVKRLEEIIEKASSGRNITVILEHFGFTTIPNNLKNIQNITRLYLSFNEFSTLPESIGDFHSLTHLKIWRNKLTTLPENIGKLSNLTCLEIFDNQLTDLPDSIGNLSNLTRLILSANHFSHVPEIIGQLSKITDLRLGSNQLNNIPDFIGKLSKIERLALSKNKLNVFPACISNLSKLVTLELADNQLKHIPDWIGKLSNLSKLDLRNNQINILPNNILKLHSLKKMWLTGNPLNDLSILSSLPSLRDVDFLGVNLASRYWVSLRDWKSEWLLDEENTEVRRILIQQIGYERICQELGAIDLDTWREYTLLKINADVDGEPMVLLKMTCPSTGHIHILRVPPEMASAEAAITWVNHGIHPDEFSVQT